MEQIAAQARVPPTRISFGHSLLFIQTCWVTCGASDNPHYIPKLLRYLRSDLAQFVLPERRCHRSFPRQVKIKMSNYPRKRAKPAPRARKGAN